MITLCGTASGLGYLICRIHQLLNAIVPVLLALGVLYLVWGIVEYVIGGGEEAKKAGRDRTIFGLIGLAVIIGVWGLVGLIVRTFELQNQTVVAPSVDFLSSSAASCAGSGIVNIICRVQDILDAIVPVLLALGLIYFIWGVIQYVIAGGEEAKKKGRDHVIYGLIGLAVIVGILGLVNIISSTFGLTGSNVNIPTVSSAASGTCDLTATANPKLQHYFSYATCVINKSIIPFMFALAFALFIWGVVQFVILNAGEEAKRAQGRSFMIWGVIALAVMLGVWGLVRVVGGTFNLETNFLPQVKP